MKKIFPFHRGILTLCSNFSRTGRLFAVLGWALTTSLGLSAQEPYLNAYFNPGEFGDGDEVELFIEYGTEEEPVKNLSEVDFYIEYEGFNISPDNTPEVFADSPSWFGEDGYYTGSVSIDHNERIIHIHLERTDENTPSGHGYITHTGGIVIDLEDIHAKRGGFISSLRAQPTYVSADLSMSWGYNYQKQVLNYEIYDDIEIDKVELLSFDGKRIAESKGKKGELFIGNQKRNLLILRVIAGDGIWARKIIIEQ